MTHIKNIFHLYRQDWRRIFKNPMAIFLIVALAILPSLYAWFNIKALWDPYGNTGELPIAVYSADEGAKLKDTQVEIGDQVVETLHDNKQLGWRFVDSKDEVVEGVKSGKYYAGIYLPKNFSEDLISFVSGDIKKPTIEYYINEKINAIAPKITDKGASSLQDQISEQFIETASGTLLKVMNQVGYDIDHNLVSINKVKNLILDTDANINDIEGYTKEVVALNGKMPEIKAKLAKANEFVDYLPQVDALGDKLVTLNNKMPDIKAQASIILTLQQKIPEIKNAGQQIAEVDADFDQIAGTMNDGIDAAKNGLQVIQQVQTLLPNIQQLGQDAATMAGQLKDAATKLKETVPTISQNVGIIIQSLQSINSEISSLASRLADINSLSPEARAALADEIATFAQNLQGQVSANQSLEEMIQSLPDYQERPGLQNILQHLQHVDAILTDIAGKASRLAEAVRNNDQTSVTRILTEIQTIAASLNDILAQIDVSQIQTDIEASLDTAIAALTNAQDIIGKAQQIDLSTLLNKTEKTVTSAIGLLEKYQKQMPAIKDEIHTANTLLNGHMDQIVAAINTGADLYQNELPVLQQKLATFVNFYQQDWPGVKTDITNTMQMVNDKLPQLETALQTATDLIQHDWPTLKSGLHKAAEAIRKGESQVDLGEVIKLLKSDANAETDFFTKPVELNTNQIYPISNNGSAVAPFYTALCLWVGAVLLSSVATTEVHLEKDQKGKYSSRETFIARMLTFLTEGFFQSLIVALGNYFLLGVAVKAPFLAVLFALIVGLSFMMMVYVLAGLFGNIGKGIAVIILVLSISGGGGNYPIQVSSKFFQFINPLLPFTHAVDLLREPAGGIYWPNAWGNIWVMVGLFVVFGILGTILYPYVENMTKKLAKVSQESHFFH